MILFSETVQFSFFFILFLHFYVLVFSKEKQGYFYFYFILSVPFFSFLFCCCCRHQVDAEETASLVDTEGAEPMGGGGGGLFGQTPRGLHGCAATVVPSPANKRNPPGAEAKAGVGSPEGRMRQRRSMRSPSPLKVKNAAGRVSSAGGVPGSPPEPAGRMLMRFRTKVRMCGRERGGGLEGRGLKFC